MTRTKKITQGVLALACAGVLVGGLELATSGAGATQPTHPAVSAPAATTAAVGGKIKRSTVKKRMAAWIGHKGITYSETTLYKGYGGKGRYRGDCSGFVSMALDLSDSGGGYSTVTITPKIKSIKKSQLTFGDLIGHVGPSSGGQNGHIQIFVRWANKAHTKVTVAEQGGLASVPSYPHYHTYSWPEHMNSGAALKAYRYKNIVNG